MKYYIKSIKYKLEDSPLVIFVAFFMATMTTSFIFWHRLIRERLPRDVEGEPYTIQFYLLCWCFITSLLYTAICVSKFIKYILERKNPTKFVAFIAQNLDVIINKYPITDKSYVFISYYVLAGPGFIWKWFHLHYFKDNVKYEKYLINPLLDLGLTIMRWYYPGGPFAPDAPRYNIKLGLHLFCLEVIPKLIAYSIFLYEVAINRHIELFYQVAPYTNNPSYIIYIRRNLRYNVFYSTSKSIKS